MFDWSVCKIPFSPILTSQDYCFNKRKTALYCTQLTLTVCFCRPSIYLESQQVKQSFST